MILWLHPILQFLATLASLYVLYLGVLRFRAAHLRHQGIVFPWKRHVALGAAVMITWALGFAFGLGVVWWKWGEVFVGRHSLTGLLMLPLIAFGLGSGLVMDRVKAPRRALPLAHGIANTGLVLLALWQLFTGTRLLLTLTLG